MQAIVLAVPITEQVPTLATSWLLMRWISGSEISPARCCPQKRRQSVHRADANAFVRTGQHGTRHELDRRNARRHRAHQLGGHGLVAPSDQHDGVHRLGADHFLRVHRHEVAQVHAGRMREALVDGNGRKFDRQAAREHHAARHGGDEITRVAVTWVEAAAGVDDADDRPGEGVIRITRTLDEGAAEKEREGGVAIARQAFAKAGRVGVVRHGRVIF
jgi:hypothetical protein